ncbi:MAG: 2-octaprenyl-6-methoxyphenyl hydroxylase [Gammaproteobacteria bacterium]|nr:MAG: 2-octaprenyl-6-methoxyphenyl hydroxylase [Gammaproteobacteria bacterium]
MKVVSDQYDILISGAGPVGAALACALADNGLRIGLTETYAHDATRPPDTRSIVLSHGSCLIFQGLGLWQRMKPFTAPVRSVRVSQQASLGSLRLKATDLNIDALGYVIPAARLSEVIRARISELDDVNLFSPARLDGVRLDSKMLRVGCDQCPGAVLKTRLLVIAEGAQSGLRTQLGFQVAKRPYHQTAITTTLHMAEVHHDDSFHRTTPLGPVALLPGSNNQRAVVMTVAEHQVDAVMSLSDADLIARIQSVFGKALGTVQTVGPRQAWPLVLTQVNEQVRERIVLLGNAAQCLHPIGAQGLNLSLKDMALLAECITDAVKAGSDPGALDLLLQYRLMRKNDQQRTILFTDTAARLFDLNIPLATVCRGLAINALEHVPGLKQAFMRRVLGLSGRWPRLMLKGQATFQAG